MGRVKLCFIMVSAVFVPAATGAAQQIPALPPGVTPEQALQALEQRPELGEIVRRPLQQSGATPDQIRAQLRSFGYPSNLLDSYFVAPDTTGAPDPNQSILQAITVLGLGGFTIRDSLLLAGDSIALRLFADSLRADSIARAEEVLALGPLQLFGLNVFRQATTQFQPISSGPIDNSYRLGPGDILVLILSGEVELAH
ncbi:MAG: hypothetical protein V3R24_09210, partial [Gemmatimonadales bacterium]